MSIADLIALIVALGAWATVYFQARSVRVAEAQLAAQLHSLSEVVQRLEEERKDRETAMLAESTTRAQAIEASANALHDRAWQDHRTAWDHASQVHVLQSLFLSRLSLGVSVLVNHLLLRDSLNSNPATERERLLVVAGLADSVSRSAQLEADYTAYILENREKGQEIRRVEDVFGERHQRATQQWKEAWSALSAFLEKHKLSTTDGA